MDRARVAADVAKPTDELIDHVKAQLVLAKCQTGWERDRHLHNCALARGEV